MTEIGGYFDLEVNDLGEYYPTSLSFNSARHALEFLLVSLKPKKIFIPVFNCEAIAEITVRTRTPIEYYNIDKNFEILCPPILADDELILYVNYFSIKTDYAKKLFDKYNRKLILDCSQAFYASTQKNHYTIYSPRKFFGVPDGGYLVGHEGSKLYNTLVVGESYHKMSHLLGRADHEDAQRFYADFLKNESFIKDEHLCKMSTLTKKLLTAINYQSIKNKRERNFLTLDKYLNHKNKLAFKLEPPKGPMIYPFVSKNGDILRGKLMSDKIYIPTYWKEIENNKLASLVEKEVARSLVALPIDQRYDENDMAYIAENIIGHE